MPRAKSNQPKESSQNEVLQTDLSEPIEPSEAPSKLPNRESDSESTPGTIPGRPEEPQTVGQLSVEETVVIGETIVDQQVPGISKPVTPKNLTTFRIETF